MNVSGQRQLEATLASAYSAAQDSVSGDRGGRATDMVDLGRRLLPRFGEHYPVESVA